VIVLAPSHKSSFLGASYIDGGTYDTPIGSVPIDDKITQIIMRRPNFFFIKEVHEKEHSLEVQVPFLQHILGDFSIVPLVVGTTEDRTMKKLGESLAEIIAADERKVGLVISTDLSHYHNHGEAISIDSHFIDVLMTMDENKLRRIVETREAEACGIGPVVIGLIASKKLGGNKVQLLRYATSGDTGGDKKQVVGYLSAAILKE